MMDRRQLGLMAAGAVAVLLFLVAAVFPLRRDVRRLREELPTLARDAKRMAQLAKEYKQLQADDRTLEGWLQSRESEFSLFSYVTRISRAQRISVASLQPSSRDMGDGWRLETVDVSLQDVRLSALVKFMHALTVPENVVQIDDFNMRGDSRKINVTFEVQTLGRDK